MPRAPKTEKVATDVSTSPAREKTVASSGKTTTSAANTAAAATREPAAAKRRATSDRRTRTAAEGAGKTARAGDKRISEEHKEAIRSGRVEARVVRSYLEALERNRPRRGPRRTVEKLQTRLERIEHEMERAEIFDRLALHQEKLSTEKELAELEQGHDLAALELEFVSVAAAYSRRRQISLQAWLAVGVPRNVLNEAGIRE